MKPEFVKRSYIYRLGDLILINPVARALNGLGVGLPEVIAVRSVDPEVIGKRLLEALDKSFDDLPDQDLDTRASLKKILSITKIRSWRTFHNNAKLVVAEFGDSAFKDSNSVTVHSIISNGVEAGGG